MTEKTLQGNKNGMAVLLLTIDVVQVRRQQLTRQDVHEIVDSVLTEIYD